MLSLIWAVLAVLPASIAKSEYSHFKHHKRQQGGEAFQLEELKQGYEAEVRQTFNARCNENNVIRRKEWCVNINARHAASSGVSWLTFSSVGRGNMSPAERQDYIRATRCLNNLPSKSHDFYAPGAQNRRDDFTVAHIANHEKVHFSPWTLAFHSWFIWLYEQALRNECGYQGGEAYHHREEAAQRSNELDTDYDLHTSPRSPIHGLRKIRLPTTRANSPVRRLRYFLWHQRLSPARWLSLRRRSFRRLSMSSWPYSRWTWLSTEPPSQWPGLQPSVSGAGVQLRAHWQLDC